MRISQQTAFIVLPVLVGAGSLAGQTIRMRDAAGRERLCQPAQIPNNLPPVDAVLDTAAFGARIGSVASEADSTPYLLSLLFAEGGVAATVRLLAPAVDDSPLPEAVRATIRPQRPGPWGLRLRVTPGPPLALAVQRSVYCPPAPDTASGPGGEKVATFGARPGDWPTPAGEKASQRIRLAAKVTLSAAGTVVQVQLTRRSGVKQLDDWFVSGLQAAQYLPALLDGLPIPSWYRTNGTRLRL